MCQSTVTGGTICALAMAWHHAREARMVVGAQQRRYQAASKQHTGFGGAHPCIGEQLTAARRVELAAARALAKACAKSLEIPTFDVDAVEVTPQQIDAMPSNKNQLEIK